MPDRVPLKLVAAARLVFQDEGAAPRADEPVALDLSAAAFADGHLWLASDELAHVERLTQQADGSFAAHRAFSVDAVVDLPAGDGGEMDIEGMDIDGGYLWVVGSHSRTRRKPKPDKHDDKTAVARLGRISAVKDAPNRYFLGRLPLVRDSDGTAVPTRSVKGAGLKAAALPFKKKQGNTLTRLLVQDAHLGPFLGLPAKENGFDIEGLAVRGETVFLGLRGPVLRGWAVVVALRVAARKKGRLDLLPVDGSGALYRKHFLALDGLGIRDLVFDGADLLVLAGPTMALSGPVRLWRWKTPLSATASQMVTGDALTPVADLPHGQGADHAEAIAWVPHGRSRALLTIYDSPAAARLDAGARRVTADLFKIPPARRPRA